MPNHESNRKQPTPTELSSSQKPAYTYRGDELPIFERATNWKRYFRSLMEPWVGGNVLELGAGIAATTKVLAHKDITHWTCLEPDPGLADQARRHISEHPLPCPSEVIVGESSTLAKDRRFNSILYIDVLEHIEDDEGELKMASERLHPGGALIVLSPAHQWLYSEFDRHVGHVRRYSKTSLTRIIPTGMRLEKLLYLDSFGCVLSLGNRLILRSSTPTARQIRLWDEFGIPISRVIDGLLGFRLGKSVLGIWRKST